jgi:putative phosphoesterase
MRIGVLSDTHGMLRPVVLDRLAGCDLLLHAGDVGEAGSGEEPILARLGRLAPVLAVRGNWDGHWSGAALPEELAGDLAGLPYRMTHRREDVAAAWLSESRLVVVGHSHRPELEWHGKCLLLNPGGCGSRRFSLPLTVAVVRVAGDRLIPEILAIE